MVFDSWRLMVVWLAMAAEPLPRRHSLKANAKNVILAMAIVAKHQILVVVILSAHQTAVFLLFGSTAAPGPLFALGVDFTLTLLDGLFGRTHQIVVLALLKTFQKHTMLLRWN
jgi:urea transporter